MLCRICNAPTKRYIYVITPPACRIARVDAHADQVVRRQLPQKWNTRIKCRTPLTALYSSISSACSAEKREMWPAALGHYTCKKNYQWYWLHTMNTNCDGICVVWQMGSLLNGQDGILGMMHAIARSAIKRCKCLCNMRWKILGRKNSIGDKKVRFG